MTNPYGKGATLDARLIRSEVVTPQKFIEICEKSPASIKSSKPIGPTLGQPGFGGIEVVYAVPKFVVA